MKQPAKTTDRATPPVPAAPGSITLVRHGEPALSRKVRFDAKAYGDWWALYEEGGLLARQSPLPRAIALAAKAPVLLVSTRRRSHESARILGPDHEQIIDEVFVEAPLPPPNFPAWLKLSPRTWGFITRFWWYYFNHHAGGESRDEAWARSDRAAQTLITRAETGENVVLVAHGFFNVMIQKSLIRRGWTRTLQEGGYRYWSIRHFEKL